MRDMMGESDVSSEVSIALKKTGSDLGCQHR